MINNQRDLILRSALWYLPKNKASAGGHKQILLEVCNDQNKVNIITIETLSW